MAPEVLIVGDVARRSELLERIRGLGYEAAICSGAALERRIARGMIPAAVVVCIDDVEPRSLLEELRRTRRGSGVPVTLHGPLGGRIGDLADVLDLGADHFLEAPADDDQLAAALEELVGPGMDRPVRSPVRVPSGPRRLTGRGAPPRDGASGRTDAVIGQLHRTLDMLEAKLKDREHGSGDEDLDLAELGFDELPDLGRATVAQAGANAALELPSSRTESSAVRSERAAPRPEAAPRHRDPTERLRRPAPPHRDPARTITRSRRVPLPVDDRGSFDRLEVPRLLWVLHRAGYSGALSLRRGRVDKRCWWSEGQLLFAHGNTGHDRLADGLLRRGLITREQYGEARQLIDAEPRRAASRLVEAGLLKPGEVSGVVRHHLVRIVDSTFPWTDGSWELLPDEDCDEQVLRSLPVALVVVEGIRHRMETRQLVAWLGGLDRIPRFRAEAVQLPKLVEQLLITPAEEAWIARFDGQHTLRELSEDPGIDDLDLLGLAYALYVLELLELSQDRGRVAAELDPAAIDIARIRDRLRRSRAGDYFQVLDLPRSACRVDVRRAHADLRRSFADEQLEPTVRDSMGAEIEELRDLVDEARDVLIDEALRSAYLAHLEEP
ncbi:MAG: hypothetical protein H6712_23175 [Myxococcales bacterium]|nr:hypothetical protein [Myxococcales bacterium]